MSVSSLEPSVARRAVAMVLATAAGYVDAAAFLVLDLFTAHMSGNSARLGVYLGGGLFVRAAPSGFAILVFVLGIAVGTLGVELLARSGRRSPTGPVLAAEVVLLAALALAGGTVAVHGRIPHAPADVFYPLAALAVLAMGLQTSTLQRISGHTVRTTYVSGMLTSFAEEVVALLLGPGPVDNQPGRSHIEGELGLPTGAASLRRIRLTAGIWLAYAGGAILGGFLEREIQLGALWVPCALLTAVIAFELARP